MEHFRRLVLGRLYIGLVERVDSKHCAGDGGGELPAEELCAQPVFVSNVQANDRLPRRFQALDIRVGFCVVVVLYAQVDEEPVVAVRFRLG